MLGPPVFRSGSGAYNEPKNVCTTVSLDADILAWFKCQGPEYQTLINEALRRVIEQSLAGHCNR
ncbi:MAG: BrnA antitoxin family protein [Methylococcales bacterium]